ncbi:MAG: hypothetical protein ABFS35_01235 [Bacteroidota bacterium]
MRYTIFIILITAINFNILANDGAYSIGPQGGTLFPIKNNSIQMLEEKVIYDQASTSFTTSFVFYNTTDSLQEVTFGFPVSPSMDSEEYYLDIEKSDEEKMKEIKEKLQFRTWVNNKEIYRKLLRVDTSGKYEFAFVFSIQFKPNEKKTVINKFKQGFGYGGDNMGRSWEDFTYVLETGAGWKGVIEKAKIQFIMNPETDLSLDIDTFIDINYMFNDNIFHQTKVMNGWFFNPKPTKVDNDKKKITWEFHNLEPDFNIELIKKIDYEILKSYDFYKHIDSLSSCIILNDTAKFNQYLNYLKGKPEIFKVDKELCERIYTEYGRMFDSEHKLENYMNLKNKTRHIINAMAALNGYEFSNGNWLKVFSLFNWYTPKTKNPQYNAEHKMIINDLLLFEEGKQVSPIIVEGPTEIDVDNGSEIIKELPQESNDKTYTAKYLMLSFAIVLIIISVILIRSIIKKKE